MKTYIKVKNILGKDKKIQLVDESTYVLKNKEEKVIGEYSLDTHPLIFKLLKLGFEVSKIAEENIQDYMKIDTIIESTQASSKRKKETTDKTNNVLEEKPKKRRGRPPKNKTQN